MSTTAARRIYEVLLVEDNPGDVRLAREALREHNLPVNLSLAGTAEAAALFLRRRPPFQHAPTPDLILLDLNLPRRNGRDMLAEIKTDPQLRRIPVVVLTSSAAESDVATAYALGANCFITKPRGFLEFGEVMRAIDAFWFQTATLPPS
jgi:CheY-like chemotaxis protein